MMKIVLFSGKAESGKTSAAKLTKDKLEALGYKVIKLSYGDYVKQTAKMLFGWNGEKDKAGRALLQWWGTDKVRAEHPNFWADTVIRLADVISDMYDFAIIDDARYENEIIRWRGYLTFAIRIERPNHTNALTMEQQEHISETALDGYRFDLTITAEGLDELDRKIGDTLIPKLAACAGEIAAKEDKAHD
jgi:hypothetical protein